MNPAVPTISLVNKTERVALCVVVVMICKKTASKVRQFHWCVGIIALINDILRLHVQVIYMVVMEREKRSANATDYICCFFFYS